ncbi:hypothetical protein GALMADRAFT_1159411 [Galerina marginata CBS 339.88]|uniref:Uncharacterized protein n=1 Tax=Galerina marginata (strain CBS 339.88) TaxID=685588 RepID=A0A067SHZ3_GALM3|nr:hypothetical protein GALMADRAFT_1159411 [Galerina marginata CBS 339.88]
MASRSNNALRRGTTPASLPLTSSNLSSSSTPNLHEAPLSELQLRSVNRLMKLNENERAGFIPLKFADEPGTPTPAPSTSTHLQRLLQKDITSRPSTPSTPTTQAGTPSHTHSHQHLHSHPHLHPSHPVQTPQQFYDWFALIDRSVAHSQEAHYRAHVASLEEHLRTCDLLVERIGEVEVEVEGMMEGWRGVEEGGRV